MNNFYKKLVKFIEESSPQRYSLLLAVPIIFLIVGFLIWNFYLFVLGFVEGEILRAKFITTGAFFAIFSFLVFTFFSFLADVIVLFIKWFARIYLKKTEWKKRESRPNSGVQTISLFLLWFFIYTFGIFPSLPLVLGGGQPRSVALIANMEDIRTLSSIDIRLPEGSTVQTESLCVVHENSDGIYVLRNNRILMIKNSLYDGLVSLPGVVKFSNEQLCKRSIREWITQGMIFTLISLVTDVTNLFRALFALNPVEVAFMCEIPPEELKAP